MSERVPNGWKKIVIGDFLKTFPKSKFPSSESQKNGYYNFYVCSQNVLKSFHNNFSSPSILFSTGGEAAVHYAIGKYSYSTDVWAVNFLREICNEYGFRIFESNIKEINYLGFQGSGIKHLDKHYIKKLTFTVPPIPEQKKISSILTYTDKVIENTQQEINKLDDLKKATINKLCTKGNCNSKLKDSKLGKIPINWEVSTVNKLFPKVVVGYVGNVNNYYCDASDGVSFYRTQNVRPNKFLLKTDVYVTKEFHSKNKKSSIKNGDVLISRVGANLGMICMVDGLEKEANAANVIVIKQTKYYSSRFLSIFLNSDIGQKNIFLDVIGGAQDVYNTNTAKSLLIPVPPKKEVNDIVDIVSVIENNISNKKNKLAQIESLKKSLMKDLLTGKVRVKVN